MSLILDALRKLERQKAEHEPSVLVVGSVPWGGTSRRGQLLLAAGAAVVLASGVFVGWLLRPAAPPTATAALPAAAPPAAPQPTTSMPRTPAATAGALHELPSAPPLRLSRPLPAPARPGRETRALSDPASAAPAPDSAAASPPVPSPADSISVAPGAAGVVDTAPAAVPGELRLTAISQRDGRPVALINDRLVFEGDSFDGVRVLRIGEVEVEVEVRGVRRVLRF
jgi:hypothetical protein